MRYQNALLLGTGLLIPLAACGGGSSGTGAAVSGITPPSQISVVQPVGGVAPPGSTAPGAVDDFPGDADYHTDEQNTYVYDPAIEPLDTINMILCFMEQCAPHHMVNQGPYHALINTTVCEAGSDPSSSEEGQASGGADELVLWAIDSQRADNKSPMHVNIWAPEEEDFGSITIFVNTTLTAPPSATNPLGLFSMDFAGVEDVGGDINDPVFWGHLAAEAGVSDDVTLIFYQEHGDITAIPAPGDFASRIQVNLQINADQTAGVASIHQEARWNDGGGDSGIMPEDYLVAFDETHFVRSKDGGPDVAFERETFNEYVWNYGVYHAAGENAGMTVELNSGFGFETVGGEYGHIGYWGLWTPDGVSVAHGDTITKEVYGDESSGEEYLVVRAPGKLIENTRDTIDLTNLAGQVFNWWDGGTEFQIMYSGGDWAKVASFDDVSGEWIAEEPPIVIDTSGIGYLDLWSNSLGNVSYVHGDTTVAVVTQSFVNGDHALLDSVSEFVLYGYVGMLDTGITGAEAELGDVYMADSSVVGTPYVFRFKGDDLTLYYDTDGSGTTLIPVGLGEGEEPTDGPNMWGMSSGPLVLSTAGLTDVWDTWNEDTYFTWETGHNDWNQFTAVTDLLGDYVSFDPPLQFMYTHSTANDRNADAAFDGKTVMLEYGGPGQLWGIPSVGVDLDGDLEEDRWYPEFSLADEVEIGPTGGEYVVKALEMEQTLAEDLAYAGTLTTAGAGALVLPDATAYTVPDIGAKPIIEEAPRVVDGHVVDAESSL